MIDPARDIIIDISPIPPGNTILILGGGNFQIPLIKKAKKLGLFVIVVDRDLNAPGAKIADQIIISSVTDVNRILSQIGEIRIDAVCTDQTDVAVKAVAEIAKKLSLKGIGTDTAERFTNKFYMRELLLNHNLPVPKFIKMKELNDAFPFIKELGFPLILKPPNSQSSKGVFLLKSMEDLGTHFPTVKNESDEDFVILEEYIDGIEYTVESFVSNGCVYNLAVSDKVHLQSNPCVAIRLTYPPEKCDQICPLLKSINENIIHIFGLPFGITHAEFRVRNGIPYLIEIAARGGGTYIASDIVSAVSGIDVYDLLIRELFSLPVRVSPVQQNAAILDFFSFKAGKIQNITGVEKAQLIHGVKMIHINVKIGQYISQISDDTNRHGFLIATGKSRDEVLSIAKKVKNVVHVFYAR